MTDPADPNHYPAGSGRPSVAAILGVPAALLAVIATAVLPVWAAATTIAAAATVATTIRKAHR